MKIAIILLPILLLSQEFTPEPEFIKFVDSDWVCSVEELRDANKEFILCKDTPMEHECYQVSIMKYCRKKWL